MIQRMVIIVALMFFLFLSGNVVGETSPITNLKSGLMVLGGTLLCVFLAFSTRTINHLLASLRNLSRQEYSNHEALVREMESLARAARSDGVRALEDAGKKAKNVFLRKGIDLVVDGYDRYEIRNIMEKDYEIYFSRKESQINVLNTSAKIAPVFGFVGTIIGLIKVLGNMAEPAEIGKGMALALLTTFYGLLFANFLFLPLAKKMSEKTKAEAMLLNIILEGVMDISEQKNAKAISQRLRSYLRLHDHASAGRLKSSFAIESPLLTMPEQRATARE